MKLMFFPWITCIAAIPLLVIVINSGLGSTTFTYGSVGVMVEVKNPKLTSSLQMLQFNLEFINASAFTITQWALYLNSRCFVYEPYPPESGDKYCRRMHYSFSGQDLVALTNHTVGDPIDPQMSQFFPQTTFETAVPRALLIASTVLISLSLIFYALLHFLKGRKRFLFFQWAGFPIVIILSGIALVFLCTAAGLLTHSINNLTSAILQMHSERMKLHPSGKRWMMFVWTPTTLKAIAFLAGVLEYNLLLYEDFR